MLIPGASPPFRPIGRELRGYGADDGRSCPDPAPTFAVAKVRDLWPGAAVSALWWSHSISLDAHPISASHARIFVRQHLGEHRLAHLTDDLELVVSELATNAVLHAQTAYTVLLHGFEQTLLLEVEDGSPGWPTHADAHPLDTGGRGLTIVGLLCRDWGMDLLANGGKLVWAEFNLP